MRGDAALPGLDEGSIPEGHRDVVEAFQQGLTLASVDLEDDLLAIRTGNRPRGEVDLERRLTVDRQNLLFKGRVISRCKHDRQHAVLDETLAIHLRETT